MTYGSKHRPFRKTKMQLRLSKGLILPGCLGLAHDGEANNTCVCDRLRGHALVPYSPYQTKSYC
jgi:hypothetical protein